MRKQQIKSSFFLQSDVVQISRELLGKKITTHFNGIRTSGMITETEAYNGIWDKACHAFQNRKTARTSVMFEQGGVAYVYLCYGIHHLLNIVTNQSGYPDAVLIRAIEPLEGIETMLKRRKLQKQTKNLSNGPGKLSQALGINTSHSGLTLLSGDIQITNHYLPIPEEIIAKTRIGIDYAEEHAHLPWRFYLKDNEFVSKV